MAKSATQELVSENKETAPEIQTPAPAMSTDALLTLIANMQQQLLASQQANAEANKLLAEAIIESGKAKAPIKSAKELAQELNEETFKKQQREQEERTRANIKWAQSHCEHIAGCNPLSEQKDIYGKTSIIWHRGDVGQTTGICTVCQRIFRQTDPDFAEWRSKRSFNKESRSGDRWVPNQEKAIRESYLHDIA